MRTTLEVFNEVKAKGSQYLIEINCQDVFSIVTKQIYNLDCIASEVKKQYPELRQDTKVAIYTGLYHEVKTKI